MTWGQLVAAGAAGLVIGIDNIISVVAFSSIIYQGILTSFVPIIIDVMIISLIIIGTITLLRSQVSYAIAQLQDETAILYSALAIVIFNNISPASSESVFITTFVTIGVTTFITGLVFYIVGKFELGNIVRYLPYPVICGFLAATGRLMISATISLLVGNYVNWFKFFTSDLLLWLPSLMAAVFIFILKNKLGYRYILQIVLFLIIILFYLVLYVKNMDIATASREGLMLGPFESITTTSFFNYFNLSAFHFFISLEQLNSAALVILLSFIALLLNVSSLELVTDTSLDLNKELTVAGQANMFSGLIGGIVGYLSLISTSFAKEQGGSRITGFVSFIPILLVLFAGAHFIEFLPKIVIGAYLFYIAISLLYEWLIDSWSEVNFSEYIIIVLIVATSIFINIIAAVGLGIIISIFLFAFRYSLVSPIKHHFSGSVYNSPVVRSPELKNLLADKGDEIQFFQLNGFLFFGSIYTLVTTIKKLSNVHYIIFDFELISNMDSSRIILLKNLKRFAIKNDIVFVFSSMPEKMWNEIKKLINLEPGSKWLIFFSNREKALQWCEEELLAKYKKSLHLQELNLAHQLTNIGFSTDLIQFFQENARARLYKASEVICHEGDEGASLLFVHRGQVSVNIGSTVILTVNAGNILGEIAMYTTKKRSATLIANNDTVIYEFDVKLFQNLSEKNTKLICEFHQRMASILANRIVDQNRKLRIFDGLG